MVTSEKQRLANRRNAGKSTGPKSRQGKRRASRNATTHGATAAPDAYDIHHFYKMIMGDNAADLPVSPTAQRKVRSLRLAEAEAALHKVTVAERMHFEEMANTIIEHAERPLDEAPIYLEHGWPDNDAWIAILARDRSLDQLHKLVLRILRKENQESRKALFQKANSLRRYRRAAERERDRAFQSWLQTS